MAHQSPSWLLASAGPGWPFTLVLGSPELDLLSRCVSPEVERKDRFPWPAGDASRNAAQEAVVLLLASCWLVFNSSTGLPELFVSSWLAPSLFWCMLLFFPRCRTLSFPLLNSTRFFLSFLHPAELTLDGPQPSSVWAMPPSFVSSANLLRFQSVSLFRLLMKVLNIWFPRLTSSTLFHQWLVSLSMPN